jgi:hypothetical protein
MGFKKIEINAVQSDDGFVVKRKNRFELEYTEKENKIVIEVEPGKGLAVYVSTLECDDKERIVKNICDALDYMKVDYLLA